MSIDVGDQDTWERRAFSHVIVEILSSCGFGPENGNPPSVRVHIAETINRMDSIQTEMLLLDALSLLRVNDHIETTMLARRKKVRMILSNFPETTQAHALRWGPEDA